MSVAAARVVCVGGVKLPRGAFARRDPAGRRARGRVSRAVVGLLPARSGPSSDRASSTRRVVRSSKTRRTTRMGLPVVGWIINPVTVFIAYAFGCLRFASGFRRTSYNDNVPTKVILSALWPIAFAVSASFRKNFKRAAGL